MSQPAVTDNGGRARTGRPFPLRRSQGPWSPNRNQARRPPAAQRSTQVDEQAANQSALDSLDEPVGTVDDMKREPRGYQEPGTVGRDVAKLCESFERIHRLEIEIPHSPGIDWPPVQPRESV